MHNKQTCICKPISLCFNHHCLLFTLPQAVTFTKHSHIVNDKQKKKKNRKKTCGEIKKRYLLFLLFGHNVRYDLIGNRQRNSTVGVRSALHSAQPIKTEKKSNNCTLCESAVGCLLQTTAWDLFSASFLADLSICAGAGFSDLLTFRYPTEAIRGSDRFSR